MSQHVPDWSILRIVAQKKTDYLAADSAESKQIYFEMCDLKGRKVAGAATIPIPATLEVGEFQTVILSKLKPEEVAKVLQKAGIET
ncbi:MAG: hypothetical protein NWF05_00615 [Candidatus Bathyarchaeota archaeon]|nr:hypothetical protein [Candidatus Bathyarchaeota archaeon]